MIRKIFSAASALGVIALFSTACSHPTYSRSVARHYDGEGKLVETVVTDTLMQMDPNSKPLASVLQNQNLQR